MPCHSPYNARVKFPTEWGKQSVPVPCGRCADCKATRIRQWVFRLMQEDKVSKYAHFITLTYNTLFAPMSDNGFMTLDPLDVKYFMKRLREHTKRKFPWSEPLKYYFVGEYGDQNWRPHYHAIVFNVPDEELYYDAWMRKTDSGEKVHIGKVHVGSVKDKSIAYTLGYMSKQGRVPRVRS